MRQIAFTVLVLLISQVAQAAAPTRHRHVQVSGVSHEQWRNSNAFAAPADVSTQSEGAMMSGIAGR